MQSARLLRGAGLAALFLAAALFGIAGGVVFAFLGDLPGISALDDYAPKVTTRVLGADGSVVGELAIERREILKYSDIPAHLRQAIISSEDKRFFEHSGIDFRRFAATVAGNIWHWRARGASTISQQLARNIFPENVGFNVSPERKIKEALVTVQIEKRYTKEEIFTMYCNQINLGHGAYGFGAAAQVYFGKEPKDLTLGEAALLAGIIQGNVLQSPYLSPKRALARQAFALDRMVANGYITQAQADEAKAQPLVLRGYAGPTSIAPYFTELIRQQLQSKYGAKAVYEGGLAIKTGLDPALQLAANRALDAGVRRLDRLRGWRKPARNLLDEKRNLDTVRLPSWLREPQAGGILQAVVLSVDGEVIRTKFGRWSGTIDKKGYEWTKRAIGQLVRRGDVIEALVAEVDPKALSFTAALDQAPAVEGAVIALDNKTGDILAMVGGSSFERSQFNRATQAMRQVGSSFKPIVYTAAIDRGYTARSVLLDTPVSYPGGPGQPAYEPKNYDRKFEGDVTLRTALENSRNVPTIRLMEALGPAEVIAFARRFGLTSPLPPYLPIAIGAGDGTLQEMTAAYTAFPGQGVRVAPRLFRQVLDKEGTMLEDIRPELHDAIRADTAYVMTYLLEGVVQHGTARSAAALNWPLGGKTGTTDDYTDAWFIGFDPDITIGVWVGFDQKRPIGDGQSGTTAALPIWIDIMKTWVDRRRATLPQAPEFTRPGNIVLMQLADGLEAFIAGTEPVIR
jgi:penicillin-binding protein 1A